MTDEWRPALAALAGIIATVAAMPVLYAPAAWRLWQALQRPPQTARDTAPPAFSPLHFAGSAVASSPGAAYLAGAVIALALGAGYSIFLSALLYAFGADALLPLWGAVIGVIEWIFTGISLTYTRMLHPAVRTGRVADPGPFALRHGRGVATALLAGHALFGATAAALYGAFT